MSKAIEQNINVDRLRLLLIEYVDGLGEEGLTDRAAGAWKFAMQFLEWLEAHHG